MVPESRSERQEPVTAFQLARRDSWRELWREFGASSVGSVFQTGGQRSPFTSALKAAYMTGAIGWFPNAARLGRALAPENAPNRPTTGSKRSKTLHFRPYSAGSAVLGAPKVFRAENGLAGSSRRGDRGAGRASGTPELDESTAKNLIAAVRVPCHSLSQLVVTACHSSAAT